MTAKAAKLPFTLPICGRMSTAEPGSVCVKAGFLRATATATKLVLDCYLIVEVVPVFTQRNRCAPFPFEIIGLRRIVLYLSEREDERIQNYHKR